MSYRPTVEITIDYQDHVIKMSRDIYKKWSGKTSSAYDPEEVLDHDRCIAILKATAENA